MGNDEMKTKVYVAAKWEDRQRARVIMYDLVSNGFKITFDWTNSVGNSPAAKREQALNDWQGVMDADAVVVILEKDLPYAGALVEMGIALGRGIPVYVIGSAPVTKKCIFIEHPLVHRGIGGLYASRSRSV